MSTNINRFVKNTLLTLSTSVLGLLVSMITSVLLARELGPEGNGIYSLATLLPGLIITFANLGISQAIVYYVAQKKYSLSVVFGNSLIFTGALGIFSGLVGLLLVLMFPRWVFPDVARMYLLVALCLAPIDLLRRYVLPSILLGAERAREFNAASIFANLSFLIFTLIAMLGLHAGVLGIIVAKVLSEGLTCIFLIMWIAKIAGKISWGWDLAYLKDILSFGIQTYIANLIGFLNYRVEVFLMGALMPASAIGFYAVAVALAEKLWILSKSAATIIFPMVSAEQDEQKRKAFTPLISRNIFLITALGASVLFVLSRWVIVLLYTEEYLPTVQLFRILLIGIVVGSASRILANDIAGRGKPILNTYISGLGLVLQVVLNLTLISRFGVVGSAWSTTASYIVIFVARLWLYVKVSGNSWSQTLLPQREDWVLYQRLFNTILKWGRNKVSQVLE